MKKVISKQITFAFIALFAFGFSAFSQKVGVGTLTPTHGFHIVPKATIEPLRIDSLRSFQMNDTAILITNPTTGVVRYIAFSELDSIFDLNNSSSAIDTAFLNNYLLTIIEATDTSYIDLSSLGKNTNFIDSLMSSNYFTNKIKFRF